MLRRYNHFKYLRSALITKYPNNAIPDIPPSTGWAIYSSIDSQVIQERKRKLMQFLKVLLSHHTLHKAKEVEDFLTSDEQVFEHNYSNYEQDLLDTWKSLSWSDYFKGLFSSGQFFFTE